MSLIINLFSYLSSFFSSCFSILDNGYYDSLTIFKTLFALLLSFDSFKCYNNEFRKIAEISYTMSCHYVMRTVLSEKKQKRKKMGMKLKVYYSKMIKVMHCFIKKGNFLFSRFHLLDI